MTGKPLVSVIVPAYNAEKFIEASLRSILVQSYESFELIVVNDGSTDGTEELLRSLAREDGRVRPVTVKNAGPAAARNTALELISPETEYIMFADADDHLTPDALEYAVTAAETGADMVIFGFRIVSTDGTYHDYCDAEASLTREKLGEKLPGLYKANLLNQVWGKLYRADLIMESAIRFRDYRWGEDRLFIYDCLEHLERLAVLPECKYHYIMHEGESLITKFYEKKFPVCLEADRRMQELCRLFGVKDEGSCKYMFVKSVFSCITTLFAPSCRLSRREKLRYVRSILRDPHYKSRSRGVYGGAAVKLLCAVTHTGSARLTLFVFRLVALAAKLSPKLFVKLKHKK